MLFAANIISLLILGAAASESVRFETRVLTYVTTVAYYTVISYEEEDPVSETVAASQTTGATSTDSIRNVSQTPLSEKISKSSVVSEASVSRGISEVHETPVSMYDTFASVKESSISIHKSSVSKHQTLVSGHDKTALTDNTSVSTQDKSSPVYDSFVTIYNTPFPVYNTSLSVPRVSTVWALTISSNESIISSTSKKITSPSHQENDRSHEKKALTSFSLSPSKTSRTWTNTWSPPTGVYFSGDATYYFPQVGACGWRYNETQYVVAISHKVFDQYTPRKNANENVSCGRRIRVWCSGKSVDVTVVDRLGGGGTHDVSLSPVAFAQIADKRRGRVQVSWQWI